MTGLLFLSSLISIKSLETVAGGLKTSQASLKKEMLGVGAEQENSIPRSVGWFSWRVSPIHGIPESVLQEDLLFCPAGAQYITCLTGNHTEEAEFVILFTSVHPGNLTEETCSALCYSQDQEYGGFSSQGQCLCGTAHESNSSSGCLPFCTEHLSGRGCAGPSLVPLPFQAQPPVSFTGLQPQYSLDQPVLFNVSIPIAVSTLLWDFGDHSKVLNTTGHTAVHSYALPGHYNVTATIPVGSRLRSEQAEIEVVASPQQLELQCPSLVMANESLDIRIRNRGGTGLVVLYGITADEPGELGRGEQGSWGCWVSRAPEGAGEGATASWASPLPPLPVRGGSSGTPGSLFEQCSAL